jgi:DNA-binding IclR family transcriptional regulator
VTETTSPPAGLTFAELAPRLGLTTAQTRRLLRPLIDAGIVELDVDGRLELVDWLVAYAITPEAPAA